MELLLDILVTPVLEAKVLDRRARDEVFSEDRSAAENGDIRLD